jgi:GNAT superfamily N-acetyltransferase
MNSKIQIEPYTEKYRQEVELLIKSIGEEFSEPISTSGESKKPFSADRYLVAIKDHEVAGTISITRLDDGNSVLRRMFLHKSYRGQGIAARLLQEIVIWARGNNIHAIYLGTMTQFEGAQKFYEKQSFKKLDIEFLPKDFPINPIDSIYYKLNLAYSQY